MPLSLNEIKTRAFQFIKEWEFETNEKAEAKTFWDQFFNVFGVSRRRVATFEEPVKKAEAQQGYIDLLWKGTILVEHKSRGKNLDTAYKQAKDYFPGLKESDLPRYILVSDFDWFRLYDLDENTTHNFQLKDLADHLHLFSFLSGYTKRVYAEQDPVNIAAAELMGDLHDALKDIGYEGHVLEVYLVRILFCLFADDTGIFEKDSFHSFLLNKTSEDGSDLAARLSELFYVLNTPKNNRLKNLDEVFEAFDYINGKLFEENLPPASFDSKMRNALLKCCTLDWGQISPAIFGSLFQSVMNPKERRNLGAHYTSEKNILKLIKGLFLDELWAEFEKIKTDKKKLENFHKRIADLYFLDPACGCGNFLVITYRELRMLEMEIIRTLQKGQQVTDIEALVNIDVDKFYGIEIEEHAVQIATVAMWLMDHQMNQKISLQFGQYMKRIPLRKSATITKGNALRIDWDTLIPIIPFEKEKPKFDFILGNPPFVGKQYQNPEQKKDLAFTFTAVNGAGILDYVTCWYIKSAQYLQKINNEKQKTKVAFVSTNSISQGEQVSILWNELFNKYKITIHFAHRTFKWGNEAKGNAAVHVVIIGFSNFDIPQKTVYEYFNKISEPLQSKVNNINGYLANAKNILIPVRKKPLCKVQEMTNGSMPNDDGNLLLSVEEMNELIAQDKTIEKYIKKFAGSYEFINNKKRYCIWLKDTNPIDFREYKEIMLRIKKVKEFREKSPRETTRRLANFPYLFGEIRQPKTDYIITPVVSSQNRPYLPATIYSRNIIASNLCNIIPDATNYTLGIISSKMIMAWIKCIGGRLKSDWRFTKDNVYNNFPWPESPTEKQKKAVEDAAQKVLDVRLEFPNSSLADLYNPLTMPPALVKAHQALDKAVDLCYRPQPFTSETNRIEYLFELYDKYTSGLFREEKYKRRKK